MMKFSTAAVVTGMLVGCTSTALATEVAAPVGAWEATTWNGERAFVAVARDWRAIVSVERGRLVYFGPAADERNVLFAPATRGDPAGWGGHRVWLGPQADWAGGWPPATAWERAAAAEVAIRGPALVLTLPPSGGGWPDVVREYFWEDETLHCRARFSGGRRPAQFIHILQVRPEVVVTLQARPTPTVPRGYVQLHLGRTPSPQAVFPLPPHVSGSSGSERQLRFLNRTEKLGFVAQPIVGELGPIALEVGRGAAAGRVVSTPDEGYVTQVYLGSGENQLIELEQLSPLYPPGEPVMFELLVCARKHAR